MTTLDPDVRGLSPVAGDPAVVYLDVARGSGGLLSNDVGHQYLAVHVDTGSATADDIDASDLAGRDSAYARVRALDAALDRAYDAEEIALQKCSEACRALRPAMLADRSWASIHDQLHTVSLDQIAGLYEPPHVEAFGNGQAVADAVGEYRKKRAAFERQFHVGELSERSAQVGQEWRETYDAAVAMPVSTPAALAQKIELLTKGGVTDDQMAFVLLDAKRVAGEDR